MRRYLIFVFVVASILMGFFSPAFGDELPVLIKEIISREFSIQVGGIDPPDRPAIHEVVSRELSFQVSNGAEDAPSLAISREVSVVVGSIVAPTAIDRDIVEISLSPTGDRVTLDWSAYNQWAELDIDHFEIYYTADGPFDTVPAAGLQVISLRAGSTSVTIEDLPEFADHYFAVVAVDVLGNFNPAVSYKGGYVLSSEVVSREVSFQVSNGAEDAPSLAVSRELSLVVTSDAPPAPIPRSDLVASTSASGDSVTIDWSAYNQWAEMDIAGFDIYYSGYGPFNTVQGDELQVHRVAAGTTSVTLYSLNPFSDHFFAVVPVDALGHYDPGVNYAAVYSLSPQVTSREISLFVGQEPEVRYGQVVSREVSILTPDRDVPDPVACLDCGFTAQGSSTAYGAIDLDWTSYNEWGQGDVVRYNIYYAESYFGSVERMTPVASVSGVGQHYTLADLPCSEIFFFAVVAEDALGNFDPVVRSTLAQVSQCFLGDVENLRVEHAADRLVFTWEPPSVWEAFLDRYRIYFNGAETPIALDKDVTAWETPGAVRAGSYSFRITTVDIYGEESAGVSARGVHLTPGYNLISYAVAAPEGGLTARQWLAGLGDAGEIDSIEGYNSTAGTMAIVGHDTHADFEIVPGQAYVLRMITGKYIDLVGASQCAAVTLNSGLNMVGYPQPAADTTCYGWLQSMGSERVSSIQRFNVESGAFESCGWCGDGEDQPCGVDFGITETEGYQVHMK